MKYYISIEKNIDVFEMYRLLWKKHRAEGIRADGMTEAVKKAIEIEKSKADELYFIDIVADDIDYMPQLRILSDQTSAPILVATSKYSENEHHEALNNGADFYGGYCKTPEQNINAVLASISSIERRSRKKTSPKVIISNGIIIAPEYRNDIFVNDIKIKLFTLEFDILYLLMSNIDRTVSYEQIYEIIWEKQYDKSVRKALVSTIVRLRGKLREGAQETNFIKNVRDVGYSFRLMSDK